MNRQYSAGISADAGRNNLIAGIAINDIYS
jgi:hypothetical protein